MLTLQKHHRLGSKLFLEFIANIFNCKELNCKEPMIKIDHWFINKNNAGLRKITSLLRANLVGFGMVSLSRPSLIFYNQVL